MCLPLLAVTHSESVCSQTAVSSCAWSWWISRWSPGDAWLRAPVTPGLRVCGAQLRLAQANLKARLFQHVFLYIVHLCVHKGKTPADQAQGDSELATYLSTQQHAPSTTHEDLETAVWGAHADVRSVSVELHNPCLYKWRSSGGAMNCFSAQRFERSSIYLYLFILFIVCANWLIDWLIVGLLRLQDASALWAAVASHAFTFSGEWTHQNTFLVL